jgi:exodeoxyribonuclease V alpha subunit
VESLNKLLQETLNPPGEARREIATARQTLREGDKVMQIRNNYAKEVFNGDIGWVESIEGRSLTARFPDIGEGLSVRYEQGELDELQLAYAMSVHKSQGGEYPIVILALSRDHYPFLQRNLLYTAVTRARRRVLIAGQKKALQAAVLNDQMRRRYSLLTERLREEPLC